MNQEENQALLALYELESHVCPHLDNISQTDPAVQYCMEQAKFHLKTAHELLEAAVLGPQTDTMMISYFIKGSREFSR